MGVEIAPQEDKSAIEGAFHPLTTSADDSFSFSRQWTVVAFLVQLSNTRQGINLILFPLGKNKFVLSRCLSIPSYYVIKEIGFYGDDGKSSLNTGKNRSPGKEGRQALGLLLKRGSEQFLWLVNYDEIKFAVLPHSKEDVRVDLSKMKVNLESSVSIVPLNDEMDEDEDLLIARTRKIELISGDSFNSRLLLCGSRGVGGVVTSNTETRSNYLALFDLEEDEEDEEESEESEINEDEEMPSIG